MDGHIFTTRGWVPAEQVRLAESVTHEDDHVQVVRVDKYIGEQWVGNDLNATIKTGHEFMAAQGSF